GWKFDTVEALAQHFNVPLAALKAQIEEYNGYVKSGKDTQFGKDMTLAKNKTIEAPFTVVRLWPKVHYCQGGVQINTKAEVKDSFTGKPIVGLYAAGEVCGGIHGISRLGSCSIPECMVMGMTAARIVLNHFLSIGVSFRIFKA
uniref:FAD-binding protein n=1 Tax=Shewanella sp. TaxID=50422 RepID=UPI0040480B8E